MLRFTLSPAEVLHVGQMRMALINYIVSRQRSEQYSVRIEDQNRADETGEKEQESLALLKKFAIEQDQLFYQSEYLGRHQQFALSLMEQGKAFACICNTNTEASSRCSGVCLQTQEQIAKRIKEEHLPFVIRLYKPATAIIFSDSIKGEISTDPDTIDHIVILNAEGIPTHTFAGACDDMLSNITLVIRDEAEISDTPEQIHIKQMLGYTAETEYLHLAPLLNTVSIKSLLEAGFLPDAIINALLSIGNNTPEEYFTLPDALAWFDLQKISKAPVTFDIERLRFLNRAHLHSMEDKALSRLFGFADADIGKLLKLYLEEAGTINELERIIKMVFAPKPAQEAWAGEIQQIAMLIQEAPILETFESFQKYLTEQSGLKGETLLTPLRFLMTGAPNGPELSEIYPLIKPYITEIARYTP